MKEAPFKLALFSILITVIRIAMFVYVIDSGYGRQLGGLFAATFAFLMAAGTYLSAFSVRFKNSFAAGIVGLLVFGAGDLLFNEAAVIYVTSSTSLIPPQSNFLGMSEADLLFRMQQLTLIFGAMPTISAAVLGWMQASFYKVSELNKAGLMGRIASAFGRIVTHWGIAVAVKMEGGKSDRKVSESYDRESRQSGGYDWRKLSDQQRSDLVGKNTRQIALDYPGIDERTALNWYYRVGGKKVSGGR